MKGAIYQRRAPLELAPHYLDCLTLVHYVYLEAMNVKIDLECVGNMPRRLFFHDDWTMLSIDAGKMRSGDVVFTKFKSKPKLIAHAALACGSGKIIHCTELIGKPVIQSLDEFFVICEQRLDWEDALRYIDLNDHEGRRKNGGKCLLRKPVWD